MQQRFHVQKERKLPLLSDKRGREREGRVGLQGALCSSLFFPSLSPVWLQPSLFSSRTRALFINVKHLHARVPHCTIYAFRL